MDTNKLKAIAIMSIFFAAANVAVISNAEIISKESGSTMRNIIPDSAITASIKSDFLADREINGLSIHVETINGVVTLTGDVPSLEMRTKAESIAKNTKGVVEVRSKLIVKH